MATIHGTGGSGSVARKMSGAWKPSTTLTVTADASTTDGIHKEGLALGSIRIPAGSPITSIAWYAAHVETDTPFVAKDENSDAITQTVVAEEEHQLPPALAGYAIIFPQVNSAGTLNIFLMR